MIAALLLSLLTLWTPAAKVASNTAALPSDPYAPLRLYDGKWDLVPASSGKAAESVHLENYCAKVGEFFACDQIVNGKNTALVVFLPVGPLENGGYAYRNQALWMERSGAGSWGNLEIVGDRWVYSSEETDNGKKIYHRTNNVFSGNDKIHFEVQRSDDGVKWTTTMSGDEARVK
jgi:hypothetical protein